MSNYQSSFHVIDLKLDIEPSLVYCRRNACSAASIAGACCSTIMNKYDVYEHDERWSVERSDEYLCTGGVYRRHIAQ